MADFKIAIRPVYQHEGGYANDKDDAGGETYRGIARKFHPNWAGWAIIDGLKNKTGFPGTINKVPAINYLVEKFYRENFWIPIGGDKIGSQDIANIIVDSAVLEGVSAGVKRAQSIVGLSSTGHITNDLIEKLNSLS